MCDAQGPVHKLVVELVSELEDVKTVCVAALTVAWTFMEEDPE